MDSAWKLFAIRALESSIPKLLGRALLECKATPSAGLRNATAITFFSNKNLIVKIWLPGEKIVELDGRSQSRTVQNSISEIICIKVSKNTPLS